MLGFSQTCGLMCISSYFSCNSLLWSSHWDASLKCFLTNQPWPCRSESSLESLFCSMKSCPILGLPVKISESFSSCFSLILSFNLFYSSIWSERRSYIGRDALSSTRFLRSGFLISSNWGLPVATFVGIFLSGVKALSFEESLVKTLFPKYKSILVDV